MNSMYKTRFRHKDTSVPNLIDLQIAVKQLKIVCPGYQRELTYQRQDGAFSTFGNNDNSGSTWYEVFFWITFISVLSDIANITYNSKL